MNYIEEELFGFHKNEKKEGGVTVPLSDNKPPDKMRYSKKNAVKFCGVFSPWMILFNGKIASCEGEFFGEIFPFFM